MNIIEEIKYIGDKFKHWISATEKDLAGKSSDEKRHAQDHTFTDDELIDQEGMESFPASDPPGHRSKSKQDRENHHC